MNIVVLIESAPKLVKMLVTRTEGHTVYYPGVEVGAEVSDEIRKIWCEIGDAAPIEDAASATESKAAAVEIVTAEAEEDLENV